MACLRDHKCGWWRHLVLHERYERRDDDAHSASDRWQDLIAYTLACAPTKAPMLARLAENSVLQPQMQDELDLLYSLPK